MSWVPTLEELALWTDKCGNLDLSDAEIAALPEGLTVEGNLHLSDSAITELPRGLTVRGKIHLSDTAITALPEGLTVEGKAPHDPDRQAALLRKVAEVALKPGALNMATWGTETCGTTMCIAGWAQYLTDDPAMRDISPGSAGLLTLGPVAAQHFYDTDEDARAWLTSVLGGAA